MGKTRGKLEKEPLRLCPIGKILLEGAIINISAEMEIIANTTADANLGLKREIDSVRKMVLQNRMALDILTAQAG